MATYFFSTICAAGMLARGAMVACAPDDGGSSGALNAPLPTPTNAADAFTALHDRITAILAAGLTADAVADAICASLGLEKPAPEPSAPLADDDPAVTEVPRDETQDSVDRTTGTLTDEAVARRAQLKADQDAEAGAQAKADAADAALADAKTADDAAHAELDADKGAVAGDEAAIAAEG